MEDKEIYFWDSNMVPLECILNQGNDKAAIYYIEEAVKKANCPMEDITMIHIVDDGQDDLSIEVKTIASKFERIRRIN